MLSIGIGLIIAGVAARNGLPLVPPRDALAAVAPWTVPVYALLVLVTQWVRATRWRFLIAPVKKVPLRDVVQLNWIGFFAIFALPFRIGEAARPALTKMRYGIPVSAGVGTIAVERVIDGLVTSCCVAFALWVVPMRETDDPIARHLPAYGMAALTLFVCAFAALWLFLWQRELAAKLVRLVFGFFSTRLSDLLSSKVGSIADGLRVLSNGRLAAGFLFETLAYWTLNAFAMWVLAVGCGLPLSFPQAVAIMGVLAIGILLPAGPGMFGSFQLAVSAGLSCYVAPELIGREGSAYVFLLYLIQAVVVGLCGVIPLYRMHLRMADVMDTELVSAGDSAGENLQPPTAGL